MDFFVSLLPQIPNLILLVVAALTLVFLVVFARKYQASQKGLGEAIKGLESKLGNHNGRDPRDLDPIFAKQPLLHIWNEYSDTLHPMRLALAGQTPVVEYRSSMPAEMMFTKESLVDGPLFDDFWRHLPGILTGLGIIGTFAGLLHGLSDFRKAIAPSSDTIASTSNAAEKAVSGLGPLLDAVMHAFMVSAAAIGCAMLVVFISRLLVARLNSKVEHLCDLIDSLYKSGAGEEYLQRLVESSEKSEVHTAQLKDALVEDLTDLVAAAISIPIKEQRGRTVLESEYCDDLLRKYENDAYSGDLWRLTWYSLLNSYLTYDLARTTTEAGMAGFSKLRRLLNRTWPSIDKQSGELAVPDWVRILREEDQLLSDNPVEKYARDYLAGNTDHIKALAENLGIPASSWFWQELVLGAVRHATQGNDEEFRSQILMLIELVKTAPVYRDKAIAEILNRYYKCSSRTVHPELRDFVIHASIWKNPKLKAAGIATAWNQVPDAVWRMVMGWVNERNLRDFFDILAARRHADHGRLKFWSRYMNQISWTRLVFGSETIWQKNHNAGIDLDALLEVDESASTEEKLLRAYAGRKLAC